MKPLQLNNLLLMKNIIISTFLFIGFISCYGQDFVNTTIDSEVTQVQPMTGIVFWPGNSHIITDAIALEYSYMDFSKIVLDKGVYDWTEVENLLNEIAGRNHQAILRFRYTYPGKTTTVPQYIKDLPDYTETEALSEGKQTWFPDWRHDELKRFTLEFYEKYAARYDNDPRLAFVQVGFGLWAEYHIYDGPFELGVTFPDKAFQTTFFNHLNTVFKETYWSISVDAADDTYSPFVAEPILKDINFGVFDDSFMHKNHAGYNTSNWNFFDRERYKISPAGGEFGYYTTYDQENVLNPDIGNYGKPYEIFAQNYHTTYMIGNDQPRYQTMERIKEASMNSGYKFKINSFQTKPDSSIIEIVNLGVAPIYINAYITINGVRSPESLKLLAPNVPKKYSVSAGGTNSTVTIESDDILSTQTIEFFGTINTYEPYTQPAPILATEPNTTSKLFSVYPTVSDSGKITIEYKGVSPYSILLYDSQGVMVLKKNASASTVINTTKYPKGLYIIHLTVGNRKTYKQKLFLH